MSQRKPLSTLLSSLLSIKQLIYQSNGRIFFPLDYADDLRSFQIDEIPFVEIRMNPGRISIPNPAKTIVTR